MENQFIPYEQALALKQLGFVDECFGYYDILLGDYPILNNRCINTKPDLFNHNTSAIVVSAPLYQQAFKWFRDVHEIQHELISVQKNSWLISLIDTSTVTNNEVYNGKRWDCDDLDINIPHTYEEAELICLKKLISICQKK